MAVFFHVLGARHHGAANVIADASQFGGFQYKRHNFRIGAVRMFQWVLSICCFKIVTSIRWVVEFDTNKKCHTYTYGPCNY